jgi:ABC-2 type transport system ATP-binding protein
VLNDLSLQVRAGEIFGLIGPSGSGKTTAMHLCCGHLRPNDGSLTVLGEQPTAFTTGTRRIGYVPQNFILYSDLTVEQNVAFAAGLYGMAEWRVASAFAKRWNWSNCGTRAAG